MLILKGMFPKRFVKAIMATISMNILFFLIAGNQKRVNKTKEHKIMERIEQIWRTSLLPSISQSSSERSKTNIYWPIKLFNKLLYTSRCILWYSILIASTSCCCLLMILPYLFINYQQPLTTNRVVEPTEVTEPTNVHKTDYQIIPHNLLTVHLIHEKTHLS